MSARIFSPAKTAMQSGKGKADRWILEYDAEQPRRIEPLMGYTSSSDMKSQVRITFSSKEEAVAYAEKNGISYRLQNNHTAKRRKIAYADNFSCNRNLPWTH